MSYTTAKQYLKIEHTDFFDILRTTLGSSFLRNNITIIIPDKSTLKNIETLIKKKDYSEATKMVKLHIIKYLYDNPADFKATTIIENYLCQRLIVKDVKGDEVIVDNGKLKKDTKYVPDRTEGPCQRPNKTAIWILSGELKVNTEQVEEKPKPKKGGDEKARQEEETFEIERDRLLETFNTTSNTNYDPALATLIPIIIVLKDDYLVLYETYCTFSTGSPYIDICIIFNTPQLFPYSILCKVLRKSRNIKDIDVSIDHYFTLITGCANVQAKRLELREAINNYKSRGIIPSGIIILKFIEEQLYNLKTKNEIFGVQSVFSEYIFNCISKLNLGHLLECLTLLKRIALNRPILKSKLLNYVRELYVKYYNSKMMLEAFVNIVDIHDKIKHSVMFVYEFVLIDVTKEEIHKCLMNLR